LARFLGFGMAILAADIDRLTARYPTRRAKPGHSVYLRRADSRHGDRERARRPLPESDLQGTVTIQSRSPDTAAHPAYDHAPSAAPVVGGRVETVLGRLRQQGRAAGCEHAQPALLQTPAHGGDRGPLAGGALDLQAGVAQPVGLPGAGRVGVPVHAARQPLQVIRQRPLALAVLARRTRK